MQGTQNEFLEMAEAYTNDTKKSLDVFQHNFLFSCFHPSETDTVLTLEQNIYPLGQTSYTLQDQPGFWGNEEEKKSKGKKGTKKKGKPKKEVVSPEKADLLMSSAVKNGVLKQATTASAAKKEADFPDEEELFQTLPPRNL
jgi:hypothetical protein